jgi:hypothetical protein
MEREIENDIDITGSEESDICCFVIPRMVGDIVMSRILFRGAHPRTSATLRVNIHAQPRSGAVFAAELGVVPISV